MTSTIASVILAATPPAPTGPCHDLVVFGYKWGGWFIVASFWFAVFGTALTMLITVVKAWKGPTDPAKPRNDPGGGWTKFLEALKGVLETLATLPAWIAIYLAGLALLWIAGRHSGLCP